VTKDRRIERPRGTHDVLPTEMPLWERITGELDRLCGLHGYRRILTPGFEHTELFLRTSGEGSDVVQKETYTFTDRGDRSVTLRPEGTPSVCRAYLEHGMHREPQPVKLYTIAPMYRYSAPQRGRYREHWQASVEAIGSDDPWIDAELIGLYDAFLRRLGVVDYRLEVNSIGCRECRPAYLARLREWLDENADRLDADTRGKMAVNPLRVLDNIAVKPPAVREALAEAPAIGDYLCEACVEHFARVRGALDSTGVAYELVPTLVRGLDYYTRTTWEFVGPGEGAQSALSGGGRYDGLIEEIGGPPTPGVGFGAGIERLVLALEETGIEASAPSIEVFFALDDEADRARVAGWLQELRARGVPSDTDYAARSLKGQLTQAGRLGATTIVLVRGDRATIRRTGGPDEDVALDKVSAKLAL
jgi:histidyl-tRNA synthetase